VKSKKREEIFSFDDLENQYIFFPLFFSHQLMGK